MDDTWALTYIASQPERFHLLLVLTATGNTYNRAKIAAKYLETINMGHIPVAVGLQTGEDAGPQYKWAEGYNTSSYPGKFCKAGIDCFLSSVRQTASATRCVYLLSLAPLTNIAHALQQGTRMDQNMNIVNDLLQTPR